MITKWKAALMYALLILLSLVVMFPVLYTFWSALLTPAEASKFPAPLVPSSFYMGNFIGVLASVPIIDFIKNSFITAATITIGQLITASLAGYAFGLLQFKGKKLLFALFLSTMMVPSEVTMIPNYLTVKSWGWMDSYQGLTVPFMATAFGTFLLRQFFMQLPKELFDAAKIDGCGQMRIYFSIALPLCRPGLATLGVYAFLHAWNLYLWPLLITNSDTMRTVQIGISMLQWEEFTSWNLVLAGVTLVLLPSLILLMLGLKQLVRSISAGAVKG